MEIDRQACFQIVEIGGIGPPGCDGVADGSEGPHVATPEGEGIVYSTARVNESVEKIVGFHHPWLEQNFRHVIPDPIGGEVRVQ